MFKEKIMLRENIVLQDSEGNEYVYKTEIELNENIYDNVFIVNGLHIVYLIDYIKTENTINYDGSIEQLNGLRLSNSYFK